MELTKSFTPEQFTNGLESWAWIGLNGKKPVFASPFGDVCFQASDGFWWLDTLEGTLTHTWVSADALNAELATEDGQDSYLLAGLAFAAAERGVVPAHDQVYGFKIAPVIGGPIDVDNIEAISFVVSLHILGQLHRQLQGVAPGTKITGFTIDRQRPGGLLGRLFGGRGVPFVNRGRGIR